MGASGLRRSSQVAILNANYMSQRLKEAYDMLFMDGNGRVGHEFVMDVKRFRKSAGIEPIDIAKRLQDFGFHSPTMSWPAVGALMVEPTESESLEEIDRFCNALLAIREEIRAIEEGRMDAANNPLKRAPHCQHTALQDAWDRPYSRLRAVYPADFVVPGSKVWPTVGRADDVQGDKHLVCSCPQ